MQDNCCPKSKIKGSRQEDDLSDLGEVKGKRKEERNIFIPFWELRNFRPENQFWEKILKILGSAGLANFCKPVNFGYKISQIWENPFIPGKVPSHSWSLFP